MSKIAVFCSSSSNIASVYFEKAHELGCLIGKNHHTLIYGGSTHGLMECVASAVKSNGGNIVGIVPSSFKTCGWVSNLLDEVYYTETLGDRVDTMIREADYIIVLPGGIGTLDEAFHAIASAKLKYHSKKVIFYNINGYWDELSHLLDSIEDQHFSTGNDSDFYTIVESIEDLKKISEERI